MNDDEKVVVLFDRYVGTLSVSIGERQITVDSLPPTTEFRLSGESDTDQFAMWVSFEEADVLAKMVDFILKNQKIREASRLTLQSVLPRIEALRDQAAAEQA